MRSQSNMQEEAELVDPWNNIRIRRVWSTRRFDHRGTIFG